MEVAPLRVGLIDRRRSRVGAYLRQSDGDYVMHEHAELRMIEVEKVLMATPMTTTGRSCPVVGGRPGPAIVEQYLASARSRDARLRIVATTMCSATPASSSDRESRRSPASTRWGTTRRAKFPSLTVTAAVQVYGDACI